MLYTFPDYYDEFTCIADRCKDTCCSGWQIVIDDASLTEYMRVKGPYKKELYKNINWISRTFKRRNDGRCAFLNDKNLCEMYINLGKGSLCKTCGGFPRHTENYENVRSTTLSISCPEVCRILMEKKEPVEFFTFEDMCEEEYRDFDPFMYSELMNLQDELIKVMQNREMAFDERCILCYAIANDIQVHINSRELFTCQEVYEKYRSERALEYIKAQAEKLRLTEKYDLMSNTFFKLYRLEQLKDSWGEFLFRTELLLYDKGRESYEDLFREFDKFTAADPMWDIRMEQIAVYFFSTYIRTGVWDGKVFQKVQMGLYFIAWIHEMLMAKWSVSGKLTKENIITVVYRMSRELEHSDINLEMMNDIGTIGEK